MFRSNGVAINKYVATLVMWISNGDAGDMEEHHLALQTLQDSLHNHESLELVLNPSTSSPWI